MGATMQGKTGIARKDTYRVLHLHLRIWRAASIELSLSADRYFSRRRKKSYATGIAVPRGRRQCRRHVAPAATDERYQLTESGRVANCTGEFRLRESGNPACNYHLRVACCSLERTSCYAFVFKEKCTC